MPKHFSFSVWIESKYLFYFVLLLNIVFLCFTKFFPSMDGPAHLYNANIIKELFRGNETLQEFYAINSIPTPNWISHLILESCRFLLPAWLSEKILLILYVSGMAWSFRYLVKVLNPENVAMSLLVFPFIYSFLFHLGFYNFCISFILFFASLGYWLRKLNGWKAFDYFQMFLLVTLTYYSNVLVFGFLGITAGLYIVYFTVIQYVEKRRLSSALWFGANKLIGLLAVSLPALIMLLIFYRNVTFFPIDRHYPLRELLKWIHDARPLIVYNYNGEKIITRFFFYVLIILAAIGLFCKKNTRGKHEPLFRIYDIMAIPLFISWVLLLIVPDGSGAGMMSHRYCLLFFIFLLSWAALRAVPGKISNLAVFTVLILHFGLSFKHLNGSIRPLNANATSIYEAAAYVPDNSIVFPVNLSDNWLEPHFSNYLGVEKPLVILENYEADVSWFPVRWKAGMPQKKQPFSFIMLYGNMNRLNEPEWTDLKNRLSSNFTLIYCSENQYVMIYQKNIIEVKQL